MTDIAQCYSFVGQVDPKVVQRKLRYYYHSYFILWAKDAKEENLRKS